MATASIAVLVLIVMAISGLAARSAPGTVVRTR